MWDLPFIPDPELLAIVFTSPAANKAHCMVNVSAGIFGFLGEHTGVTGHGIAGLALHQRKGVAPDG
jgi:hypothetical protein